MGLEALDLSLLDHQFARLLEHYTLELKEAAETKQPLQSYEYEAYIEGFLAVLREYRLRIDE